MKLQSKRSVILALVLHVVVLPVASAWTSSTTDTQSRRQAFKTTAAIFTGATAALFSPLTAHAETTPSQKDLEKLQRGHARVRYLLENWDSITQTCGKGIMTDIERKQVVRTEGGGGGFCEKTPLKVQDYLGYKSTN